MTQSSAGKTVLLQNDLSKKDRAQAGAPSHYLENHDTGECAEVPDGGVRHGQVVGRYCVFPTTITIQTSTYRNKKKIHLKQQDSLSADSKSN